MCIRVCLHKVKTIYIKLSHTVNNMKTYPFSGNKVKSRAILLVHMWYLVFNPVN
jgi:hypothetical protein